MFHQISDVTQHKSERSAGQIETLCLQSKDEINE